MHGPFALIRALLEIKPQKLQKRDKAPKTQKSSEKQNKARKTLSSNHLFHFRSDGQYSTHPGKIQKIAVSSADLKYVCGKYQKRTFKDMDWKHIKVLSFELSLQNYFPQSILFLYCFFFYSWKKNGLNCILQGLFEQC